MELSRKTGFLSFLNKTVLLRQQISERMATVKVMLMSDSWALCTIMSLGRTAPHLHCRFSVSIKPQIFKKTNKQNIHRAQQQHFFLKKFHFINKSVSRADLLWENPAHLLLCWYLLLGRNNTGGEGDSQPSHNNLWALSGKHSLLNFLSSCFPQAITHTSFQVRTE